MQPELPGRQRGLASREQLRAAGVTDSAIKARLASGRWVRVLPRVVATFTGELTPAQRRVAAVLYAGEAAALSHATAGSALGWVAEPRQVHVSVPLNSGVRSIDWVRVHRCREDPRNFSRGWPPLTDRDRTLLDLVRAATSTDAALAVVADAVRSGRTTAHLAATAIEAQPTLPGRGVLLDALGHVAAGAGSGAEVKYGEVCRCHGIPIVRQQVRHTLLGVASLIDFLHGFGVTSEVDGRLGHSKEVERWRDMQRDNAVAASGGVGLRYGWSDLNRRGCHIALQVGTTLLLRGWPGPIRKCSRTCPC